jgi:stage II sporulation protein P
LLVAYVVAVGFTVGILINRAPDGRQAVPATTGASGGHGQWEVQAIEPPLWLQLFRPSQPTARRILRTGLPILAIADGSSRAAEHHQMKVEWAGQAGERPQTFFQTMLPFLRPAGEQQVAQQEPPSLTKPPAVSKPPEESVTPPVQPPRQEPIPAPPAAPAKEQPVQDGLPLVGIYHTHDWESYMSEFPALKLETPDDLDKIKSEDHSKRTVMEVGRAMAIRLKELGVTTVFADYTHKDFGYDYAYTTSRATAKEILKRAPSVKVLLDLHRDAAWNLDTTAVIGNKKTAQIRCIVGSANPKWEHNRQFCESLMQRLEAKYPGITLATRIQGETYTYNQDLMPGAILLEIGGATNQYAEAERSVLYLAEVLAEMMREGAYPH